MKNLSVFSKTITLLLLLGCLLATLAGCGKGKAPSDSELISVASELIEKSYVINSLFFEKGIPIQEGGKTEGTYQQADAEALSRLGFSSYASMAQYAENIFSEVAYGQFLSMAVERQSDGTSILRPAYCFDAKDNKGNFVMLMVSLEGLNTPTDKTVFDLSTLKVSQKTATTAILEVSATVTDETGATQTRAKQIGLVLEEGEWQLDTLTCMSYFVMPTV